VGGRSDKQQFKQAAQRRNRDKLMKKLTTAALLVGGAMLASQSAFAQPTFVNGDLYLGFQNQNGGGSSDYIINLGAASGIVSQSSVVDLSGDISSSLFNAPSLQGTSPQILWGVVGANNAGNPSQVWGTLLRTSNIGTPALAGSSAPGGLSTAGDTIVAQQLSNLIAPPAGTGVLDGSKTWENYVEPALSIHSFWGNTGFNPDSSVDTSTVLYEDLWGTSDSSSRGTQPFNYMGYFTLDLTGPSPSLTFTPQAVPEPTVLDLLGGVGLLLLPFRRRLSSKNS
jgi:hypothetical protein